MCCVVFVYIVREEKTGIRYIRNDVVSDMIQSMINSYICVCFEVYNTNKCG